MYLIKSIVVFTIAIILPSFSAGHDFIQEAEKLRGLPVEEFLDQYPFQDYIEVCSYDNIRELEYHKRYLNQMGIDGKAFIYRLYEEYVNSAEMDFSDLSCIKKLLFTGELLSKSQYYLHSDSAIVYVAASDLIFSVISDSLEILLDEGKLEKKDFSVRYIVDRLSENKYQVDVPVSNYEKLWMHLKNGNYAYIWRKAMGTYFKEFLISLCVVIPIGLLMLWLTCRWWRKRKRRNPMTIDNGKEMAAGLLLLVLSFSS